MDNEGELTIWRAERMTDNPIDGWRAFVPGLWGSSLKHEIIIAPTLDALYDSIQSYMKTNGGVFEEWELTIDANC